MRPNSGAERVALKRMRDLACCVWPECNRKPWVEIDLPICQHHAAKVYLRIEDHR